MYLNGAISYYINKDKGELLMHIPIKRSSDNKILAGVVGGLAERFNWNPAVARILWVIISLTPISGVIAYLVLWLLMENPE